MSRLAGCLLADSKMGNLRWFFIWVLGLGREAKMRLASLLPRSVGGIQRGKHGQQQHWCLFICLAYNSKSFYVYVPTNGFFLYAAYCI